VLKAAQMLKSAGNVLTRNCRFDDYTTTGGLAERSIGRFSIPSNPLNL
jgi:hypothetical protein